MSSGDKVRTEGSNVTLECAAHGSPKPTVTWKREDRLDITIDRNKNITGKQQGYEYVISAYIKIKFGSNFCILLQIAFSYRVLYTMRDK